MSKSSLVWVETHHHRLYRLIRKWKDWLLMCAFQSVSKLRSRGNVSRIICLCLVEWGRRERLTALCFVPLSSTRRERIQVGDYISLNKYLTAPGVIDTFVLQHNTVALHNEHRCIVGRCHDVWRRLRPSSTANTLHLTGSVEKVFERMLWRLRSNLQGRRKHSELCVL